MMARFLSSHTAKNPDGAYVHVRLTPREAKIASMVLGDVLTVEIADHFAITVERVDQIIKKVRRKIDYGRAEYAKATQKAANKPCTVRSRESEEE
jgi:DNA-binding CsgD family transcriptional regulator